MLPHSSQLTLDLNSNTVSTELTRQMLSEHMLFSVKVRSTQFTVLFYCVSIIQITFV